MVLTRYTVGNKDGCIEDVALVKAKSEVIAIAKLHSHVLKDDYENRVLKGEDSYPEFKPVSIKEFDGDVFRPTAFKEEV